MASKSRPHKKHATESKVDAPLAPVQTPATPEGTALKSPDLYINRELSLLEFQCRVLEEAIDQDNPLLERVKFLAILGSNLDEFFMVRVAGLMKQVASGSADVGRDGRPATAQLELIREKVRQIAGAAHDHWRQDVQPALEREGIMVVDSSSLDAEERAAVDSYFHQHVFPVLTPLAFDPGRPFPHISNLQPEPGRGGARPDRGGALRPGQGSRHVASVRFRKRQLGKFSRILFDATGV